MSPSSDLDRSPLDQAEDIVQIDYLKTYFVTLLSYTLVTYKYKLYTLMY